MTSPVANTRPLAALKELQDLELARLTKLTSLAGIEGLSKLEDLNIDTCRRVHSIDEVRHLTRLRSLGINNCGDIESFKPLNQLTKLEHIAFVDSTNVLDGDLWPLKRQEHLRTVAFRNRRHYTHRREELDERWKASGPPKVIVLPEGLVRSSQFVEMTKKLLGGK